MSTLSFHNLPIELQTPFSIKKYVERRLKWNDDKMTAKLRDDILETLEATLNYYEDEFEYMGRILNASDREDELRIVSEWTKKRETLKIALKELQKI